MTNPGEMNQHLDATLGEDLKEFHKYLWNEYFKYNEEYNAAFEIDDREGMAKALCRTRAYADAADRLNDIMQQYLNMSFRPPPAPVPAGRHTHIHTPKTTQDKEKQLLKIDYPLACLLGAERAIIKQCYDDVPFADEKIVQALHALMHADGSEDYRRKTRNAFIALDRLRLIVLREGSPREQAQIALGSDAMLEFQDSIDDLAIEQGWDELM